MTKLEREVMRAALAWWAGHRPTGWSRAQHHEHPTVNANATEHDERLARAVANWRAYK